MLTLALHHDESVFVYLSEVQKGKKNIEQLGLFSLDFSFNTAFLYQKDAKNMLSAMLKEIIDLLSVKDEDLYFSFPADLIYISLYDQVLKEDIQSVIDKDVWLTELKFGHDFIKQSDCQVKVSYKEKNLASLTAIYYPKMIYELLQSACRDNHCKLVGMGVNIFNATEIVKNSVTGTNYIVIELKQDEYELVNIVDNIIVGYTRFTYVNEHLLFFARNGVIPDGLCKAVVTNDATILQRHIIYLTGSSTHIHEKCALKQAHEKIKIINPMVVNTTYLKPSVAYDKQYDTVFSSALGALI